MGQTPMAVVFPGSLLRNASLAKGFHDVAGCSFPQPTIKSQLGLVKTGPGAENSDSLNSKPQTLNPRP